MTLELPVVREEILRALYYRAHPGAVAGWRKRLVGLAAQLLHYAASRIRQRLKVVTALHRRNHPATAVFRRHPLDPPRERGEAVLGHAHSTKRVAKVRVEA